MQYTFCFCMAYNHAYQCTMNCCAWYQTGLSRRDVEAGRVVTFTKIVPGCACWTLKIWLSLYNFLPNNSPTSILFLIEKQPILTKLGTLFLNSLLKIHPIYVIWAPFFSDENPLMDYCRPIGLHYFWYEANGWLSNPKISLSHDIFQHKLFVLLKSFFRQLRANVWQKFLKIERSWSVFSNSLHTFQGFGCEPEYISICSRILIKWWNSPLQRGMARLFEPML